MALKQENINKDGVNRDYIDIKYEGGETTFEPKFVNKEWVEAKSTSWVVKGFYGAYTKIGKWVKSITVVLIDDDGDEQHINGSIWYGTKDIFNGLINNVGNKVNISIYLNDKGYTTWSVRDENGNFVKNTLYPFDKINFEEMWKKVCGEYGYWLTEKGSDGKKTRIFIKGTKETKEDEDIDVEDLPF